MRKDLTEKYLNLIESFSRKKILVVGDTIVDETTYTKATGNSLESPTLKTELVRETYNLGGAANVARNIAALTGYCMFATNLSRNDAYRSMLGRIAIHTCEDYKEAPNSPDTIKHRIWVEQANTNYKYLQVNSVTQYPEDWYPKALVNSTIETMLPYCDALVISDYRTGFLSDKMKKKLINAARKLKKPIYVASQVSSKGSNFESYIGADYLALNMDEAMPYLDRWPEVMKKGEMLDAQFQIYYFNHIVKKGVYITQGKQGSIFSGLKCKSATTDEVCDAVSSHGLPLEITPKNIIGAGDSFYAAAVAGCEHPALANDVANMWAGLYAQKEIGELPCLEDLKDLISK